MPSSSHIKPILNVSSRDKVIEYLSLVLDKHKDDFDTFIVSGYSMTVIGSILAFMYEKELMIVRKTKTINSDYNIEGLSGARCVFVDDLICTGDTLQRCIDGAELYISKIIGIVTWSELTMTHDLPEGVTIPIWSDEKKFEELRASLKGI